MTGSLIFLGGLFLILLECLDASSVSKKLTINVGENEFDATMPNGLYYINYYSSDTWREECDYCYDDHYYCK
jgi:hypothetical protein